jgi:radical SAM family uncharacterized protein/radical SAM-linked protein
MRGMASIVEAEILPQVEKPSRYLGTEWNSVHKDPAEVRIRVALAFPDRYDLGLGNLGLQILYHLLNRQPDVWAERAYAPAPDLEEHLRRRGLPLFSLEGKTPLSDFDAIGFTLQSELTYTNLLNMLDLGGIPLLSAERDARHPLILAGGPGAFNPEPLADFIDAFVVGEGEEVILELAEVLREFEGWEGKERPLRERQLERLAEIPGVYVPALYPTVIGRDGTVLPAPGQPKIVKRVVADLDQVPFPTDYLVPYTQQIHDRVSLEVLRGCTQGCRFCQAGLITRPVRERTLEHLDRLLQEVLARTGYEEVALASLNTCDHSRVRSLVRQSVARAAPQGVSVALPSLRLDSFSVELADLVSAVRPTGLTFAPEAATDRLRAVINKYLSDQDLLDMARECYGRGWEQIKLYFMIGLPTETDEDVMAIADLANRVLDVGRRLRRQAGLHLGVSTFCPKPHTPFQWEEQIGIEETERRQKLLLKGLKKAVKCGRHDARESFLEGLLSRGDRRTGKLLLIAQRLGCRFDAWSEHRDWSRWQEACRRWEAETGCRPADLLRARSLEEPLPWDHIDPLVSRDWLQEEYRRSRRLLWQEDCRRGVCQQCGVRDRRPDLCRTMQHRSRQGAQLEKQLAVAPPPRRAEPAPVQRLRFRFAKRGLARLLSHLETLQAFRRALRRAGLPISYSQGFHPQPRLAFGTALATGIESEGEYADLFLTAPVLPDDFIASMNAALPPGLVILAAREVPLQAPSLMAVLTGSEYHLSIPADLASNGRPFADRLAAYLAQPEILVERPTRQGLQQVNLRPLIAQLRLLEETPTQTTLLLQLADQQGRSGKPLEVLTTLLGLDQAEWHRLRVQKLDSLTATGDPLQSEESPGDP